MTDIVRRLRERQADMAETIERLDTSEFDTGATGQIRAELHDLYREAADEIDRLTRERNEARAECEAMRAEVVTLQNERAEARMLVDLLERNGVNAVELLTTVLAQIEQERSEQAKEG